MTWGTKTNIGYYAQNLEDLWPGNEVIQELRRVAPQADNGTLRGFLAKFLFFGDDVFKPVSALSGGEKGRLSLAKLIYSEKNVLVLDEPTNHLDIPSRESLETALDEYTGTVIVVSHDRYFLDKIATQILSFERDGSVLQYSGNYTEFHDWKAEKRAGSKVQSGSASQSAKAENFDQADEANPNTTVANESGSSADAKTNGKKRTTLSKNEQNRITARIAEIENTIPQLEERSARLTEEMSEPSVAADFERFSRVTEEQSAIETELASLLDEWERLAAQAEEF
jgi:ATP-binding cassette subfamily F protein 3